MSDEKLSINELLLKKYNLARQWLLEEELRSKESSLQNKFYDKEQLAKRSPNKEEIIHTKSRPSERDIHIKAATVQKKVLAKEPSLEKENYCTEPQFQTGTNTKESQLKRRKFIKDLILKDEIYTITQKLGKDDSIRELPLQKGICVNNLKLKTDSPTKDSYLQIVSGAERSQLNAENLTKALSLHNRRYSKEQDLEREHSAKESSFQTDTNTNVRFIEDRFNAKEPTLRNYIHDNALHLKEKYNSKEIILGMDIHAKALTLHKAGDFEFKSPNKESSAEETPAQMENNSNQSQLKLRNASTDLSLKRENSNKKQSFLGATKRLFSHMFTPSKKTSKKSTSSKQTLEEQLLSNGIHTSQVHSMEKEPLNEHVQDKELNEYVKEKKQSLENYTRELFLQNYPFGILPMNDNFESSNTVSQIASRKVIPFYRNLNSVAVFQLITKTQTPFENGKQNQELQNVTSSKEGLNASELQKCKQRELVHSNDKDSINDSDSQDFNLKVTTKKNVYSTTKDNPEQVPVQSNYEMSSRNNKTRTGTEYYSNEQHIRMSKDEQNTNITHIDNITMNKHIDEILEIIRTRYLHESIDPQLSSEALDINHYLAVYLDNELSKSLVSVENNDNVEDIALTRIKLLNTLDSNDKTRSHQKYSQGWKVLHNEKLQPNESLNVEISPKKEPKGSLEGTCHPVSSPKLENDQPGTSLQVEPHKPRTSPKRKPLLNVESEIDISSDIDSSNRESCDSEQAASHALKPILKLAKVQTFSRKGIDWATSGSMPKLQLKNTPGHSSIATDTTDLIANKTASTNTIEEKIKHSHGIRPSARDESRQAELKKNKENISANKDTTLAEIRKPSRIRTYHEEEVIGSDSEADEEEEAAYQYNIVQKQEYARNLSFETYQRKRSHEEDSSKPRTKLSIDISSDSELDVTTDKEFSIDIFDDEITTKYFPHDRHKLPVQYFKQLSLLGSKTGASSSKSKEVSDASKVEGTKTKPKSSLKETGTSKDEVAPENIPGVITRQKNVFILGSLTPKEIEFYFLRGHRPEPTSEVLSDEDVTESELVFCDHDPTINFLLDLGFDVEEATTNVKDDEINGRLHAAIVEARIWADHITTTQGVLMYLLAHKCNAKLMRYYLNLVEAIINRRITNAVKLHEFMMLLEHIEDGIIKLSTIFEDTAESHWYDDDDDEGIARGTHLKMVFINAYKVAAEEAQLIRGVELEDECIFLLRYLTLQGHTIPERNQGFIARYIGQRKIRTLLQLEAALIFMYSMNFDDLKIQEFEDYCGISDSTSTENDDCDTVIISEDIGSPD